MSGEPFSLLSGGTPAGWGHRFFLCNSEISTSSDAMAAHGSKGRSCGHARRTQNRAEKVLL